LSSLIELNNITKVYRSGEIETPVIRGVSLSVELNELVAFIGTSGSGKSSLMNIMGLLDKPTTGQYLLGGQNVSDLTPSEIAHIRNKKIGFIFQSFFLMPRLKVLQNVGLPLGYRELSEAEIAEKSHLALQRVGLDHLSHRYPRELSGGQQQRIAIARALVGNPSVIFADEPTGALDSKVGQDIMDLFIQLNKFDKNTIIIITHDSKIASQCPRVIRIQDGLLMGEA